MDNSPSPMKWWHWAGLLGMIGLAIGVTGTVMITFPVHGPLPTRFQPQAVPGATVPGIRVVLTSDEQTIESSLSTPAFLLQPNQSLDSGIPPGSFVGEFTITFDPGDVRKARIGAEFAGGTLFIERFGKLLSSNYASDKTRIVLPEEYQAFAPMLSTLTYKFESDGDKPARFRAIWQPENSQTPRLIPVYNTRSYSTASGTAQLSRFSCLSCHAPQDDRYFELVRATSAPDLTDVGKRLSPQWIRSWIVDPAAMKPDTAMPRLFHGDSGDAEHIEDIVQFLASLGGSFDADEKIFTSTQILDKGQSLYHQIGCIACHGSLESLSAMSNGKLQNKTPLHLYSSFIDLAKKTSVKALGDYLQNPMQTLANGRMPSFDLTDDEAHAIAVYLIEKTRVEETDISDLFVADTSRIERGKMLFMKLGCANCHAIGGSELPKNFSGSFESLFDHVESGCLADEPATNVPHFTFTDSKREEIRSALIHERQRQTFDAPIEKLNVMLKDLNCLACHRFNDRGGLERAIGDYFGSPTQVTMGSEGRLPPDLTGVGAKLTREWLDEVLIGHTRARPYMTARMPHYGEQNVNGLADLFIAAAGMDRILDNAPTCDDELRTIGEILTDRDGLNCVMCHALGRRTPITRPAPALTDSTRRLRYSAFRRWVLEPTEISPNTRMPAFFPNGRSALREFFDGRADKQIEAIWCYCDSFKTSELSDSSTPGDR